MLTEIRLKNFKCFRELTTIPVSQINLLTGINSRGKSTALQALLLMRQSPEHSRTTNQIIFNGSCVAIGNFNDVKNSLIPRTEPIELMFRFQKDADYVDLHYFLKKNDKDDMVADIENLTGNGKINDKEFTFDLSLLSEVRWYNLFPDDLKNKDEVSDFIKENVNFTKIHYISADRIGPRDYYAKQSFAEFPNVGRQGEYTANVLSKLYPHPDDPQKKEHSVYEKLCLDAGETNTVVDQTAAWLSAIFGGGKINVKPLEANIVLMELNSEDSLNLYKPVNVGFGYSYALPIIASGLIARTGEILIVENPEAHLHPYAQSQITKFLATVSACGIQVFIESHSDHILNGLRIAILDGIITPTSLNILYFDRNEDNQIVKIPVGEDGSIEDWPSGFFDQTDKDFKRLFGF